MTAWLGVRLGVMMLAGLLLWAPIDRAHGADPSQPKRALSLPEPRVLARIKQAWRNDRKAANIELANDLPAGIRRPPLRQVTAIPVQTDRVSRPPMRRR